MSFFYLLSLALGSMRLYDHALLFSSFFKLFYVTHLIVKIAISEAVNNVTNMTRQCNESALALLSKSSSMDISNDIEEKIERTKQKVIKQSENLHSQRFSKLCPDGYIQIKKSTKKRHRKFIPRAKYKRLQKKKIERPSRSLVTNYSDFPIIGTPCESVLVDCRH